MKIEFFIDYRLAQKGNSKEIVYVRGRPRLVSKKDDKRAEGDLIILTGQHRPQFPLAGAVQLDVTFIFPIPEGWPVWKREAARVGGIYPKVAPDRGNMLKLLEDAMQAARFFTNDSHVVDGYVAKRYGLTEGYLVCVEELVETTAPARKKRRGT